jgi:membrane associated rhomboid family serine protease
MKKRDFRVGVITLISGITCSIFSVVLLLIELKGSLLGMLLSALGGCWIVTGTVTLCRYNRLKNKNKDNEKIEDENIEPHDS